MKRLLLVMVFACLLIGTASAGMWEARTGQNMVIQPGDTLVLMGGATGTFGTPPYSNETWKSTDNGATWTLVNASSGWAARRDSSSVVIADGSIILIGGYDDASNFLNDVWRSTDNGTSWSLLNASSGWSARASHSSVVSLDGRIVLTGGMDGSAKNDTWISTSDGVAWDELTSDSGWQPRFLHSTVLASDGSIVLTSGYDNTDAYNDTWRSTNSGLTWSLMNATPPWVARETQAMVRMADGDIILIGGVDGYAIVPLNDTWESTDNGSTWTLMNASSGWAARGGLSAVTTSGDYIIITGGDEAGDPLHNDTWMSPDHGATWAIDEPVSVLTANFNHVPNPSGINQVVVFNDTTAAGEVGTPLTYNWTFGDTGTSTSKNTTHIYTSTSIFSVSLNVTDTTGNWSNTSKSHSVIEFTPVTAFSCSPLAIQQGASITCNDTSTNYPTMWNWSLGDGTFSNQTSPGSKNISYVYGSSGVYTVALTVSNGNSTSNTLTRTNYIAVLQQTVDNGFASIWFMQTNESPWTPRPNFGYTIAPDGDIFIIGGGFYGGYSDVWKSSDKGRTWTLQSDNNTWGDPTPVGRGGLTLNALADGSLLMIGGYSPYSMKNDTWRSTNDGVNWTQLTSNAGFRPRWEHSSVVLSDGSILLVGGINNVDYSDDDINMNDTWRSTDNGTTWAKMSNNLGTSIPMSIYRKPLIALNDSDVLLVGAEDLIADRTNYSSVWYSGDHGANWNLISSTPQNYEGGYKFPACYVKGYGAYYLGGYNFTYISKDNGLTWNQGNGSFGKFGQSLNERNFHGAVCTNTGEAIVMGGKTNASGILLNDVWITYKNYTHIFFITGSDTGAAIPIVKLTDNNGQVYYTGNGTGFLVEGNGNFSVDFLSSGYTSKTLQYYSDADAVHYVTLTPAPTVPSQNTWWTPHTVQVTVMDANYGTRLYDVNIQARYNETSMPTGWINSLYGIGSTVQADMINQTLIMNGTTGSEGTVTFTMLGSIKYDFTLNAAQYGISNYKVMAFPSDNMLNIYILTTGSLLPTQRNSTYTNLNGTRVYFTEPDINNISMCIDYIDTSGETSSVTFTWKFTNGTTLNTSTVNPGTGLNTICNVTRNIRGTQVVWGYNATRSVVTV